MNDLMPFSYEGQQVRTVLIDGEPWFVAADVAAVLGYSGGARNATGRLPERMRGVAEVNTPGGAQQMIVIRESGVYRLVLRSNVPGAEAFQDWLAEEVIPVIRREGGYISPTATTDQLTRIINHAQQQMQVLRLADGLVDRAWLEAKARHVTARALGEEPEVPTEGQPLDVGTYLQEQGLTDAQQRRVRGNFGKALAAAYRKVYGREPEKVPRFVDGALRKVSGYTERDRPMFDEVWLDLRTTGWI